jgi:hypothetical protein
MPRGRAKGIQKTGHFTVYIPARTPDEVVSFLQTLYKGNNLSQDLMTIIGQYLEVLRELGEEPAVREDLVELLRERLLGNTGQDSINLTPAPQEGTRINDGKGLTPSQILRRSRQNRIWEKAATGV